MDREGEEEDLFEGEGETEFEGEEEDSPLGDDLPDSSSSLALQMLEELVKQGKLDPKKAEFLKSKYEKLNEVVVVNYEHASQLTHKVKRLKEEHDKLAEQIPKFEQSAREDLSAIESLKSDKAKVDATLQEVDDRLGMSKLEKEELEKKLERIEKEIHDEEEERIKEARPLIEKLERSIESLQEEIPQQKELIETHTKKIDEDVHKAEELTAELERMREDKKHTLYTLRKVAKDPELVMRQVDVCDRALEGMRHDLAAVETAYQECEGKLQSQADKKKAVENRYYELTIALENQRTATDQKQRHFDDLSRNIEIEKDKKMQIMTQQLELEMEENALSAELGREKEAKSKLHKDRELKVREIRKLENAVGSAKRVLAEYGEEHSLIEGERKRFETQRKKDRRELEDVQKEVDVLINSFLKQETTEKSAKEEVESVRAHVSALERELMQAADEQKELEKHIASLASDREKQSRTAQRVKQKLKEAIESLRQCNSQIRDMTKRGDELQARIKFMEKLYSRMKKERNTIATTIQKSSQKLSEIKEKNKILANELDVLWRESTSKDQELQKERRDLHSRYLLRENLRAEYNRLRLTFLKLNAEIEEQLSQVERLNGIITGVEEGMLRMKDEYERLVEDRNFRGIQLIDRNDELCILYEKTNIQETILKQGEMELRKREESLRHLTVELGNVMREIEVCKRQLPLLENLSDEVMDLQNQVLLEKSLSEYFSMALENPANKQRWRKLEGRDLPFEKLDEKMTKLEERLNDKKESLLEKQLVLEEIASVSEKLKDEAGTSKARSLEIAKKVNLYHHGMRKKTRAMMAAVSELSMYQATAMKLQQVKEQKEAELQEALQLLEMGEAPTVEAEEEFYRMEHDRLRHADEIARIHEAQEALQSMPATITRTTAEPRPTAYIPDDDLGLPKPYGGHAPFKPSIPGTTMRHIRPPEPKEIEL
eukprot:TRINITY_DN179_c1_g1_i1.p1 TRINITY_DN179_c1_g1~~TRINITY_DN179_c1_g1_i1.p1  ORF type:complete len:949 (+),score=363.28 TRINITY_DN179_c1_g1_i1:287-3133(+)